VPVSLLPRNRVFDIYGPSGQDQRGDGGICGWLGEDEITIFWIRLCGVISFLLDSVASKS